MRARAWLGATIVNAVASWKGAAVAISEHIEARLYKGSCDCGLPCMALRAVGGDGFCVEASASLGFRGGVKSSSAVVNASLLAFLRYRGVHDPSPRFIVDVNARVGIEAGVSVTGAADDAYASLLGGVVVVDNRRRVVVKRYEPPRDTLVVLLKPRGVNRLWPPCRPELRGQAARVAERAWEEALEGRVFEAVRLNWEAYRGYLCAPLEPVRLALEAGALAASLSGLGPVYEAFVEEDAVERVVAAWRALGEVTVVRLESRPVCCLTG
ncbi:shikimate kinase [Pyrolobus fumarii 1A]|uniref:Shikimate kinase n=1 Tax=Pyrolobus fumarii (strain DSM 11204 / 1A) TaxID=694429 RepID=G0ED59_PYRF1|nr:shikimate kinase [Pyrolobus fumarii]AEM39737.1 shikimate kinase [Pyrolobus fumarii 1A]